MGCGLCDDSGAGGLLEQIGDAHVQIGAMEGEIASVAVKHAVVVAEAETELVKVVEGYATAEHDVEGLVVVVVVEVASVVGSQLDASNSEATLAVEGGGDAVAERGTCIEGDGKVISQGKTVVEVHGHADVLLFVLEVAFGGEYS